MNDEQLSDGIRRAFGRYRAAPRSMAEIAAVSEARRRSPILTRRRTLGGLSLAGVGVALAVAIAAMLGQAPAGQGPSVWAGWQPIASKPDPALREQARAQCFPGPAGLEPSATVPGSKLTYGELPLLIQDQRGKVATFIFARDSTFVKCTLWRDAAGRLEGGAISDTWSSTAYSGAVEVLSTMDEEAGGVRVYDVFGRTRAARVVVVRDDGVAVEATVQDGVYVAWWPGNAQAVRITAYDGSGKLLESHSMAPMALGSQPPDQGIALSPLPAESPR